MDRLLAGILQLRNMDEGYRFFEDLCTVGELKALAGRLQVAALLRGGATYEEIRDATGMSSATISRIKRFLFYGADGYALVLDRLANARAESASGGSGETIPPVPLDHGDHPSPEAIPGASV